MMGKCRRDGEVLQNPLSANGKVPHRKILYCRQHNSLYADGVLFHLYHATSPSFDICLED